MQFVKNEMELALVNACQNISEILTRVADLNAFIIQIASLTGLVSEINAWILVPVLVVPTLNVK